MRRGELYLVRKPGSQDSSSARLRHREPVYSRHDGLSTQVSLGTAEGLKHESSIHCDELVSLPKTVLSRYVGRLDDLQMRRLDRALSAALDLDDN